MEICARCGHPVGPDQDRCPACRRLLRPFEWLKTLSGWLQLAGYLVGFVAVMLATEREWVAAGPLGLLAAGLLVAARRRHLKETGRA